MKRGSHKTPVDLNQLLQRAQQQAGSLSTAVKHLRKAIKIRPIDGRAYLLLARIQQQQGQTHEAMHTYKACLSHGPDNIEALINLGMLYKRSGQPDAAIASYEKALQYRRDIPEIYNNLGNAWLDKSDFARAETAYQQAVTIQTDFAGGWHNLGRLFLQRQQPASALQPLRRARQLRPDAWQIRSDLADCLVQLPLTEHDPLLEADLLDCLRLQRIDGRILNRAVSRYLRQQVLREPIEAMHNGRLELDDATWGTLQQPLLNNLLLHEPLCDWTLEQLLRQVRYQLLHRPEQLARAELAFVAALAEQCFLNEYLWDSSTDENEAVEKCQIDLERLAIEDADPKLVCLYACYRPLSRLIGTRSEAECLLDKVPKALGRLLQQQVIEPAIEIAYQENLPVLTPIENTTSQSVREQYENNPYPRWRMLDTPDSHALGNYLCLLFSHLRQRAPRFKPEPDILCAGCGTGLQALRMARRIQAAQITAIDISRNSLAYGQRQATTHGHDAIRFAQADILNLTTEIGRFDCIECYGVLHHLADPIAGWRSLRQLLKPGGVMRIGLYSRAARGPIRRIREMIQSQNLSADIHGIRRMRQNIAALAETDPVHGVLHSPDFYSVSECRDLMFHVQEHQLDLATLMGVLDELDLEFLGFEFDDYTILNQYRSAYPDDPHAIDLQHWHEFEAGYPDSFAAQYIFWARSV